jgi:hypothetical protein
MSDTLDTSDTTVLATNERDAINGLLRWQLGRRMTVCLLAFAATHAGEVAALEKRLASIEEILVMPPAPSADAGLDEAARQDAEIVLVWLAANEASEVAMARALLERVDTMGLRDRSFVALIGPAVTRELAHHLRFEEGYPTTTPTAQLLWSLAREAIARDELRRRGSSPPCYL